LKSLRSAATTLARIPGSIAAATVSEADTLGFVVGLALVVTGTAMIYVPAAFLIAGGTICFGALNLMRSRQK